MNLFFRPSYIQQPSNRPPAIADATVVTTLIAAKAAVQAQIDSAMVDLKAACVLAARQELEGGGGALAAPMIDALRVRLTDLEGRIKFYTLALDGLGQSVSSI